MRAAKSANLFYIILGLLFSSCASTNRYELVARNMFMTMHEPEDRYVLAHRRQDGSSESVEAVRRSALECAATLEHRRSAISQSWFPTNEIATIQLVDCLKDAGWTIDVQEAL